MDIRTVWHSSMLFFAMICGGAASAAEPVGITAINARTGMVTARDTKTRQLVEFRVANAALLKSLKVGQTVYVDYGTQEISVDNGEPCCNISRIQVDK